jgi:hypothetical protein
MGRFVRSFAVGFAAALLSSVALAADPVPSGSYRYSSGNESGTWVVANGTSGYTVAVTTSGTTWNAPATLSGNVLTVTRAETPGVNGALGETFDGASNNAHATIYEASFDSAFQSANGTVYDLPPGGQRTKLGALILTHIAEKAVADGGVWVETRIAGGPTVDFTTSVPGPIPAVTFTAGIKASALVSYTADDLYPVSASDTGSSSILSAVLGAAPSSATAKPPAAATGSTGIFAAALKNVDSALSLASGIATTGSVSKSFSVGPYAHLGVELSTGLVTQPTGFMADGLAELTGAKEAPTGASGAASSTSGSKSPGTGSGSSSSGATSSSSGASKTAPSAAVEALLDALKTEPARVFEFPSTGEDALALPQGTRRIAQGQATIVVSGGAELGLTPAMLKSLAKTTLDKTKVASLANASVSATIEAGVTGDLSLMIERQDGSNVLLVWTSGVQATAGAALTGEVGVDLTKLWKDVPTLPPSVEQPVNAKIDSVLSWGDKTFSFGINASANWLKEKNFAAKLVLDVSTADGKNAFAAAVRGDLTTAKKLSKDGENKAVQYQIVNGSGTERLLDFGFNVGKLTFNRESDAKQGEIDVDQGDGSKLSIGNTSFQKSYTTFLHGNTGTVEEVGTTRTKQNPDGSVEVEKRASYVFKSAVQKKTDATTAVNYNVLSQEIFGSGVTPTAPSTTSGSQVELRIELSDAAVKKLMDPSQTSLSAFYTAMGQAEYGPEMMKTKNASDRANLKPYDWSSGFESPDASSDEKSAFQRASEIWSILHPAAKNGQAPDPLDSFAQAAKKAGDDPAAFIAFANLAGTSEAQVSMAVDAQQSSGTFQGVWDKTAGKAPALIQVANPLGQALGADPTSPGDTTAPSGKPSAASETAGAGSAAQGGPIVWGSQIDASHWNAVVMGRPAVVEVGVSASGHYSMIVTFSGSKS